MTERIRREGGIYIKPAKGGAPKLVKGSRTEPPADPAQTGAPAEEATAETPADDNNRED